MPFEVEAYEKVLAGLPDDAYHDLSEGVRSSLLLAMDDLEAEGMAIATPRSVDMLVRDRFPVAWATNLSARREWSVRRKSNGVFLRSDLDRGSVSVDFAFSRDRKREAAPKPSRTGTPPREGAMMTDVSVFDLRVVSVPSWTPGRYAVALMLYDWLSNVVVVELTAGTDREQFLASIPRISRDVARTAAMHDLAAKSDLRAAIHYGSSDATPKLEGPGAAFVVPAEVSASADRIVLHAAATLALPAGTLVSAAKPTDLPEPAGAPRVPVALVPVTVVVAKLDERRPRSVVVRVPVYGPEPLDPGAEAQVAFSADLKALLGTLAPAEYQVYVVAGEHMSGPRAMAVST